jgi:hypothetical protein
MDKNEVMAALSILVLSGVLVYAYKYASGAHAANAQQAILTNEAALAQNAIATEILASGSANAYNNGAAIYLAATPYLFQVPLGNVIPSSSAGNTLPGAQGFNLNLQSS